MARYFAEGDIYELLQPTGMAQIHVSQIDVLPRADVAPRAEVAREIFEEIEKHGRKMQSSDFSGDFWDIAVLMSDIAELKNKYTEDQTDDKG